MTEETLAPTSDFAQATALTISRDSGVLSLATMSDEEFTGRLAALKKGQERVLRIQKELLTPDVDYGTIQGTQKPTLLKPGAEKLCAFYQLVATFHTVVERGDGVTQPPLRVFATCTLHHGSADGPVVAEGFGSANVWERKHRYRAAQRKCPECSTESIRRSQYPDRVTGEKGWYCHQKIGGCGKQYAAKDPQIVDQECGQVQNPDPHDVDNTVVKMACKRSYIDTTLRATATSGLFTQDLEDMVPEDLPAEGPKEPKRASKPDAAASPALITNEQRKKVFAAAKAAGWTDDDLREYLYSAFGFETTSAITRASFDQIMAKFEPGPGKEAS